MTLVGKKAPSFQAPAVIDGKQIVQDFSLDAYRGKQEVLFFFYPKDFTFVCPTELYAMQERLDEFAARNVAVVGCSTDTEETHWAWLHVAKSQGGIKGVTYPLVADSSKSIAANYGVLAGNWYVNENEEMQFEGTPVAYRGVFLIDKEGYIRHMLVNDLPMGRSIDEMLRTTDMMQHVDKYGEVCPANWQAGKEALEPTPESLIAYIATQNSCASSSKECLCAQGGQCQGNCRCKRPDQSYSLPNARYESGKYERNEKEKDEC